MNETESKNSGDRREATSDSPFQFTLRGLLVLFAICAVLMGMIAAGNRLARLRAREAQCSNQLKQIGIGLLNYHTATGTLPPADVADGNGRALNSWRLLLQPYADRRRLSGPIVWRMHEPWNSPHNSSWSAWSSEFQCPIHEPSKPGATNYLAITGPDTAWPGSGAMRLDDIKDGPSETILIVEVPDSNIHWMEPRDLDFAGLEKAIKKHGGLRVAFADGSVGFIPASIPRAQLKALVTIAAGEKIDPRYLPNR